MYDPIELSKKTEDIVIKGDLKKYYRFRATRFYGGIATADTVGCNLRCKFCWSGNSVWNANNIGEFYTPDQVLNKLKNIATKKGFHQMRISGGEPTIGRYHLISLLKKIEPGFLFILETNGILLGTDKSYVKDLSEFNNLHIRVCFKGSNPKEFSFLTGAKNGFEHQIRAIENLKEVNIRFNIALVTIKKDYQDFINRFSNIDIEIEDIFLYPKVRKRLDKEGIIGYFE
ncbi:MAG: radical SAM protein [Thermoplasmatales archaeon]|nr:MAG: radical SAM protein [Thermoplasmatales archaeon]